LILILKPYRAGDYIIAQGQEGIVSSIQLFYTIIITQDNRTVIIPNSKLSNEVIINVSEQGKRRLDVEMKFSYAYNFDQIKTIIQKTLHHSPLVENDPEPRIGVSGLDPDGFRVMINAWVNAFQFDVSRFSVQQILIQDLKDGGIKLPGMT
jgi:small conductance mechanosensitive channel